MTTTCRPIRPGRLRQGHDRLRDRIRTGKDSGFGRFPSRQFAINAAWLELALVGIDLLARACVLLLDSTHALAEPKKLRYRPLHVAARIVRTARRVYLRIAQTRPWANELATAYARLVALPRPAG
jgi:Transposase DDE domain group 1